ncbi:hypothetical protein LEP1GSC062_1308 [Leptospira alexanderi serovar Manhao 3 str. L 60]|uniref:Uncharacterized protein n=1 Tax=Leptospira alexanderi serovar Manhao 3 str. L 60 TaxID=1049759 RepID=V6HVW7_9LEPT|nr:hypothetical protein LEP1GSC062_1308 [Leptospira alexanderi serovar Manhao 3 str. L 60]
MCGEKIITQASQIQENGSTPRVWGKVGKVSRNTASNPGSTPRVWGKDSLKPLLASPQRFNPTCVGKRPEKTPAEKEIPVQPHVCGEKNLNKVIQDRVRGSTPRVWGKASDPMDGNIRSRFNPTCVGKREHFQQILFKIFGSTPRVWGKVKSRKEKCPKARFNPTCVGKSPIGFV